MYQGNREHDKTAARKLARELLHRGCTVSVHDGEEWACKRTTEFAAIVDAMGNTDADTVTARDAEGVKLGAFYLVYGNGPGETIADHTANDFCESVYQAVHGNA